jgi:hypothetical protein
MYREAENALVGTELEQRRLAHRATRIRHALDAMRQLAGERTEVPGPLRHGITDFGRELERVEGRLRELDRWRPSADATARRASSVTAAMPGPTGSGGRAA